MTKVTRVRRLNIQRRRKVKKTLVYLGICIVILGLLNACAISSDKKISEEKIHARQEMFEKYLEEKTDNLNKAINYGGYTCIYQK